jgi:hypothetical protein
VKEVLALGLGFHKFIRRWVPHALSSPQKIKRVEGSTKLTQILNDSEAGSFDGIATGDEF